jgi:hypothetical protein
LARWFFNGFTPLIEAIRNCPEDANDLTLNEGKKCLEKYFYQSEKYLPLSGSITFQREEISMHIFFTTIKKSLPMDNHFTLSIIIYNPMRDITCYKNISHRIE